MEINTFSLLQFSRLFIHITYLFLIKICKSDLFFKQFNCNLIALNYANKVITEKFYAINY